MPQNVVNCKVKLMTDGEMQEMRRFVLDDAAIASNIMLFKGKLRMIFMQAIDFDFKLTWIDSDGDMITITNDEELITAMMEMEGVKQFQVHTTPRTPHEDLDEDPSETIPMQGHIITCDVCNARITRYRYKCLQCVDYDLCLNCEQAGNHSHHIMMRLADLEVPRFLPKFMHHMTRSARKAAHHAAKEAHRAARTSARVAHAAATAAASGYSNFRCPRNNPRSATSTEGSRMAEAGPCPAGNLLNDLADSFFWGLSHGPAAFGLGPRANQQSSQQGQQQQPQPQQQQQDQQGQQNQQGAPGQQGQENQQGAPGQQEGHDRPQAPVVLGDILRNIFTVINDNLNQAQGNQGTKGATGAAGGTPAASSGTSTPQTSPPSFQTPVGVSSGSQTPVAPTSQTPVAVQTEMQVDDVVEQPKTIEPTKPSPPPVGIVPQVQRSGSASSVHSQQRETGWTLLDNASSSLEYQPPTAPAAVETGPYAEPLAQLRRMGFSDRVDLQSLLRRYNGNIGLVINHLLEGNQM